MLLRTYWDPAAATFERGSGRRVLAASSQPGASVENGFGVAPRASCWMGGRSVPVDSVCSTTWLGLEFEKQVDD